MREHMGLFRGKRKENGEWVEGGLIKSPTGTVWIVKPISLTGSAMYLPDVDPETVGECTGLRDKNGKLIFEGDVCLCDRNINDRLDRKMYEIKCEPTRGFFGENFCEISADEFYMAEIIGTIHDNPELLKGGEQ